MKKLLFLLAITAICTSSIQAQSVLDKAKQVAQVLPIKDVGATSNGILSLLKTKLALSDSQSPKIGSLLTDFLQSKSGILNLASSKPAEYKSKFSAIQDKLMKGIKAVTTVAQYSKLLGLKPKAPSSSNLLSHLFF